MQLCSPCCDLALERFRLVRQIVPFSRRSCRRIMSADPSAHLPTQRCLSRIISQPRTRSHSPRDKERRWHATLVGHEKPDVMARDHFAASAVTWISGVCTHDQLAYVHEYGSRARVIPAISIPQELLLKLVLGALLASRTDFLPWNKWFVPSCQSQVSVGKQPTLRLNDYKRLPLR